MSRSLVFSRLALSGLLAATLGCGSFSGGRVWNNPFAKKDERALSPDQQKQREWWKANSDRKKFVPGKGFQIDGVEGFFDEQGRPIDGAVQQASFSTVTDLDKDPEKKQSALDQLDPKNAVDKVKAAFGQGPNERRAKELSTEADDLFRKKEYGDAAEKYEQAAKRWPGTNLAEDALFMQGESHFFAEKYPAAIDAYQTLIKQYPSTRHLDNVMRRQFDVANYWQKTYLAKPRWPLTPNLTDKTQEWFDTIGHAIRVYEHIRLNDPTGPLADDALMATATAYFLRGRYDDADYHFGLLRREYPSSDFQYQAHLLGLQCKLKRYQGPDYDGTVLVEADKIAEQLLKQFPTELSKNNERQRVNKLRQELAAQQALRQWTKAKYYEGRNQYGAARSYWNKILDKYPDTKLAHEAKAKLAKTQEEPDRPAVKAAWLIRMFDGEDSPTLITEKPQTETTRR